MTVFCFNGPLVKESAQYSLRSSSLACGGDMEGRCRSHEQGNPIKTRCSRRGRILVGGLVGIILPLLGKLFPKHEKWIPSAAGIGLSWTFQWSFSFLFFLGVIGYAVEKKSPSMLKHTLTPWRQASLPAVRSWEPS